MPNTNLSFNDSDWLNIKNQYPTDEEIDNILAISRIIGEVKEIKTWCGNSCYLVSFSDTEHLILIPSNVTRLNGKNQKKQVNLFTDCIEYVKGTIRVLGGSGLITVEGMFNWCDAEHIDLRMFNTSNVKNMNAMFRTESIKSLTLGNFDTSQVRSMNAMFSGSEIQNLDVSTFDTSLVRAMNRMFEYCKAKQLNLSSFNTSNVKTMYQMFRCCKTEKLDLTSFDMQKVEDTDNIFLDCYAEILFRDPIISDLLAEEVNKYGSILESCDM